MSGSSEFVHNLVLAFFVVELAVRFGRAGWRRFFIGRWNCFDAAVIALSTMPVLGVDASLLRVARMARMVHLMRHASHLRLSRLLASVTRLGPVQAIGSGMMTESQRWRFEVHGEPPAPVTTNWSPPRRHDETETATAAVALSLSAMRQADDGAWCGVQRLQAQREAQAQIDSVS